MLLPSVWPLLVLYGWLAAAAVVVAVVALFCDVAAVVVAVVTLAVRPLLVFIGSGAEDGVWPGALGSMLKIFFRYQFPLGKSTFMMQTKHTSLIYKNLMNYRYVSIRKLPRKVILQLFEIV